MGNIRKGDGGGEAQRTAVPLIVTGRAGRPSCHSSGFYKGETAALPISIAKQSDFLSCLQGRVFFSFPVPGLVVLLGGDLTFPQLWQSVKGEMKDKASESQLRLIAGGHMAC